MPSNEIVPFPVSREYEKHHDISPDDIARLRDWLHTQPHLPAQYITDLDLIITYHCCEKSSEVAKQVLDLHFTLRTLFTTYFKNRSFNKMTEHVINSVLIAALPMPTVNGYRAIYGRVLDPDPRSFFFPDSIRTFMMMFDLWQLEEGSWPGFVIIIDMDKSVIGHLARLDISNIRQVLYFLQEAMLVKLKEVHFINAPSFMDKVLMMFRPFMKKQLMDLLRIHQIGSDTIYKFVPKESFPKELGGKHKSYQEIADDLRDKLLSNAKFFEEENKRRVQESLRPGGKKSQAEQIFGIEGSFKKLDID